MSVNECDVLYISFHVACNMCDFFRIFFQSQFYPACSMHLLWLKENTKKITLSSPDKWLAYASIYDPDKRRYLHFWSKLGSQFVIDNVRSSKNVLIIFLFFDFLLYCGKYSLSLQFEFVTSYQCFSWNTSWVTLVQNGKMMIHTKLPRICLGACLIDPRGNL